MPYPEMLVQFLFVQRHDQHLVLFETLTTSDHLDAKSNRLLLHKIPNMIGPAFETFQNSRNVVVLMRKNWPENEISN